MKRIGKKWSVSRLIQMKMQYEHMSTRDQKEFQTNYPDVFMMMGSVVCDSDNIIDEDYIRPSACIEIRQGLCPSFTPCLG